MRSHKRCKGSEFLDVLHKAYAKLPSQSASVWKTTCNPDLSQVTRMVKNTAIMES